MTRSEEVSDCALCHLDGVPEGGRLPGTDVVVAYVDDDLIGLIPEERPGVLLAPREHTGTLFETPERAAAVLAPLRQLVEVVKSFYGVGQAAIEPTTHAPTAPGHVCYQVLPVFSGESEARSDPATLAAALAEALRRRAAVDRRQQSGGGCRRAPTLGGLP